MDNDLSHKMVLIIKNDMKGLVFYTYEINSLCIYVAKVVIKIIFPNYFLKK